MPRRRRESGGSGGRPRNVWSCPFSQARMIEVTDAGKVIFKSDHNAVKRFSEST